MFCGISIINQTMGRAITLISGKLPFSNTKKLCITCIIYSPISNTEPSQKAVNPFRIWERFLDNTFVIQHYMHKEEFLEHINSVGLSFWFTVKETRSTGSMQFLYTIIAPQRDETFIIGIYRKPSH